MRTVLRMLPILCGMSTVALTYQSEPKGDTENPTYFRDIKPLFLRSCVPCHRSGGPAPFALDTYESLRKHGPLVRIQSVSRAMPPFRAHTDFGEFSDIPILSDSQLVMIQRWFQLGQPKGEQLPNDPAAHPKAIAVHSTWSHSANGYRSRAEGVRYWMTYRISTSKMPKLIRSLTFTPKSPKLVTGFSFGFAKIDSSTKKSPIESFGTISNSQASIVGRWAPGYRNWTLPTGSSLSVPAGHDLLIQVQYQPSGKEEDAGFVVAASAGQPKDKVTQSILLEKPKFEIPVDSVPTFLLSNKIDRPIRIHSVVPEARFYCSKIKLLATLPNNETIVLYDARPWDVYWTGNYQFATPVALPAGTVLEAAFTYANDEFCSANDGKKPAPVFSGAGLNNEACKLTVVTIE